MPSSNGERRTHQLNGFFRFVRLWAYVVAFAAGAFTVTNNFWTEAWPYLANQGVPPWIVSFMVVVPSWTAGLVAFLIVVGVYLSWRVVHLEKQLRPSAKIHFDDESPFVHDMTMPFADAAEAMYGTQKKLKMYRLSIENVGNLILDSCKTQVTRVTNEHGKEIVGINFSLMPMRVGTETFSIRPGEEEYVNLIAIPLNRPGYPAKIAAWGETWPEFGPGGSALPEERATIEVRVLSDGPPARIFLEYVKMPDGWHLTRRPYPLETFVNWIRSKL